jgi:peptidoglycan hydrolase-like protein with peptidoglycan-binding domain
LFVAGLDVRLAFGRVRDEVLKSTKNRQEPFVSGSLGGAHLSLVPAPVQPAVAAVSAAPDESGQKNDYALVERIGTKRAWEVFLNQHPTGFYAELARQHISKLIEPGAPPAAVRKADEPVIASLTPSKPPSPSGPSSEEQRAWDRIKGSSNAAAFRDFIRRYPSSVLANTAQTRLEALERAVQEREEKARAEREAKAAEAERQRAEREAALKRAEEERQTRAAEAARQRAEREAAARKAEEERKAKAAEAAKRAEEERLARLSDTEREKAERAAAARKAEEERRAKAEEDRQAKAAEAERQKAEREAALKRAEEERQAKLGAAARARQERQDGACRREADLLATLKAAASSQAWAREDLKRLEQSLTCERLRPEVVAALGKEATAPDRKTPATAVEPAKPAANTPDLVRSAQKELARIGCFTGTVDGNFNSTTQAAIKQYQTQRGRQASAAEVTDDFIAELRDRRTRVCPLVCPAGKVVEGDTCVAARKPAPVARQRDKAGDDAEDERPRPRQKAKQTVDDDEDDRPRSRQRARQQEAKPERAASRPQPRVRQEAARPSPAPRYSGGGGGYSGGGGGGRPMIGVGF